MGNWIEIQDLCVAYEVEIHFIEALVEHDIIEITIKQELPYIQESNLEKMERIFRLNKELEVNVQGIDVVLNLIQKIEDLNEELLEVKNKLRRYE